MTKGLFISFEGIDGCGKSTQLRLLSSRLASRRPDVVETAEPGGTPIGRSIRAILLAPETRGLAAPAELLLYFASRAQNVAEVIHPALDRGAIVLCDRFTDSTVVYQGAGRGLDPGVIWELHRIACANLLPDLTLLLEIDLSTSLGRAKGRNLLTHSAETRMDEQTPDFYERVRDGYAALAQAFPKRIRAVDARGPVEEVAARVWNLVQPHV